VKNGQTHFDVGRLQVGYETPLEPGDKAVFEILNLAGWTVAGQHDLFMGLVESVEGMEEFFLDTLFAGEELDVVDQEDIGLTVPFAEFNELIVLYAIDVVVCKLFRRNISNARALFVGGDMVADGVEQMCFAKTDTTV
jgi:hypothetical protein